MAGLILEHSRDWEGIACTDAVRHSAYLSEEGTPGMHEYDLADGSWLATLATPSVFSSSLPGRGFESLTRWCNGAQLWTANEEALTVDGLPATPGAGRERCWLTPPGVKVRLAEGGGGRWGGGGSILEGSVGHGTRRVDNGGIRIVSKLRGLNL